MCCCSYERIVARRYCYGRQCKKPDADVFTRKRSSHMGYCDSTLARFRPVCGTAGIAQLVVHDLAKVGVASSSLVSRSRNNCHSIRRVGAVKFQIPHQGRDVRFPSTVQGGERNPEGNGGNLKYRGGAEIGSRARLRILWGYTPCGFESRPPHENMVLWGSGYPPTLSLWGHEFDSR